MPTPTTSENQDQQPQELTQDEIQAIWNEEAAARRGEANDATPGTGPADDSAPATDPVKEETKDEPAAGDKKAKTPESTEQKPAPGDKTPEDPVAKRFDALEQELKRTTGRVGAMQRELAQAAKRATEKSDAAPTQAQQAAAIKNPEKWDALKKEFPEWGEAINDFLTANLPQGGVTKEQVETQVEERVSQRIIDREVQRIERRYPKWQETVQSDDFKAWRAGQPAEVQALGASDFAEDAIEMLDLFNKRNAKPAPRDVQAERASRLAAAASNPRASRTAVTPKDDSELSADEIWKQEAGRRAKKRAAEAAA